MAEKCEIRSEESLFTQQEIEMRKYWLSMGIDVTQFHLQSEGVSSEVAGKILERKFGIFVKVKNVGFGSGVGDLVEIGGRKYILTAKHVVKHLGVQDVKILSFSGEEVQFGKIFPHQKLDIALVEVRNVKTSGYILDANYVYGQKSITVGLGENDRPHVTAVEDTLTSGKKFIDSVVRLNPFNKQGDLVTIPNNVKPGDSGSMVVDELGQPKFILLKGESVTQTVGYGLPITLIHRVIPEILSCKD